MSPEQSAGIGICARKTPRRAEIGSRWPGVCHRPDLMCRQISHDGIYRKITLSYSVNLLFFPQRPWFTTEGTSKRTQGQGKSSAVLGRPSL